MPNTEVKDPLLVRLTRAVFYLWVVALVLALTPYTSNPAQPIKDVLTSYAATFIAALWLSAMVAHGRRLRVGPLPGAMLVLFLAINLLAALFSDHPGHSLNALRAWVQFALLAVFAAQVFRRPGPIWTLFAVVAGTVALSSIYGFCQWLGLDPFPWGAREIEEYRGLPSTYANPNFAGHTLVMAIFLAGGLTVHGWRRRTQALGALWTAAAVAGAVGMALMGTHLYLTHMRGGRVALLAAACLLAVYWISLRGLRRPMRAAVTAVAVLGVLGASLAGGAMAVLETTGDDEPLPIDGSLVLRLNGYHGACRMLLERPVLGFGPGNYKLYNAAYWTPYESLWFALEHRKNAHVHCDVLENGIEAGAAGSAVYIALLAWAVLASLTLAGGRPDTRGIGWALAGAFSAFAVDGLFGFNMHVPVSAGLFFLFLGVLDGARREEPPEDGKPGPRAIMLAAALAALAMFCTVFETRSFLGERLFQRAQGALHWAEEYRADAKRYTYFREQAYKALLDGWHYLPWEARFPRQLGQIDLGRRRFAESVGYYQAAIRLFPRHPEMMVSLSQAHINHALSFLETSQDAEEETGAFGQHLDAARRAAEAARALAPQYADAQEALGRIAFLRGVHLRGRETDAAPHWREAAETLERALELGAPDRATLNRMLAQAHIHLDQADRAEAALRLAVEAAPEQLESWQLFQSYAGDFDRHAVFVNALTRALGRLKERAPQPVEAIVAATLRLAGEYALHDNDAPLAAATLAGALGSYPERLDLWTAWLLTLPPGRRLPAARAVSAEKLGKAPARLREAVAGAPGEDALVREATRWLIDVSMELLRSHAREEVRGRIGWLARRLHKEAVEADLPPAERGLLLMRAGGVYAGAGDWNEADTALEQAIALLDGVDQVQAMLHRSEVLGECGKRDEALRVARQAARLMPGSPSVRWNLARQLVEAGRLKEARFEYTSLVQGRAVDPGQMQQLQTELQELEQRLAEQNEGGGAL